jgi:hypothetical protein
MKYIFTLIFISAITVWGQEQDKEVTLTVSGSGETQNEAKERALRNSIEQAFGAFISSKTEILNDELISDQIISLTTGNIKSFEILSELQLPSGGWSNTIRAVVSVNKLKSFTESKGIKTEIQGGLFAVNVKQQILNELAEVNSMLNLFEIVYNGFTKTYDFEIIAGNPKSVNNSNSEWEVPLSLNVKSNSNILNYDKFFRDFLKSVSLSSDEVQSYQNLNKQVHKVLVNSASQKDVFYLRSEQSKLILIKLGHLLTYLQNNFIVSNELGNLKSKFYSDLTGWRYNWYHRVKFNVFGAYPGEIEFFFPKPGDLLRTSEVSDFLTLSEIEKITAYNVNVLEPQYKYNDGGLVLSDSSGHGIILSMYELDKMDWNQARSEASNFSIESKNDWEIPNIEDYKKLNSVLEIFDHIMSEYWTSIECDESGAFYVFSHGNSSECDSKESLHESYLIRRF